MDVEGSYDQAHTSNEQSTAPIARNVDSELINLSDDEATNQEKELPAQLNEDYDASEDSHPIQKPDVKRTNARGGQKSTEDKSSAQKQKSSFGQDDAEGSKPKRSRVAKAKGKRTNHRSFFFAH